ncbi:hypothetical protein A2U01_0116004, partial [Trifolium medium]|nr:hypothetical protein [Trifolium medium]
MIRNAQPQTRTPEENVQNMIARPPTSTVNATMLPPTVNDQNARPQTRTPEENDQ